MNYWAHWAQAHKTLKCSHKEPIKWFGLKDFGLGLMKKMYLMLTNINVSHQCSWIRHKISCWGPIISSLKIFNMAYILTQPSALECLYWYTLTNRQNRQDNKVLIIMIIVEYIYFTAILYIWSNFGEDLFCAISWNQFSLYMVYMVQVFHWWHRYPAVT